MESISHQAHEHNDSVTYELLTYVFGCMPSVGESISLHQIAEDLEESPETILWVLGELHDDKFIDFIFDEGIVTVTYKDEIFLQQYSVYQATRR